MSARATACSFVFLVLAIAGGAWARASDELVYVVSTPFTMQSPREENLRRQTVRKGETFLIQSMLQPSSAVLEADLHIQARFGEVRFAAGMRLFQAINAETSAHYYCGPYLARRLSSWFHTQWACLADTNADDTFDTFYSAPLNGGIEVPSFHSLLWPKAVSVPYSLDTSTAQAPFDHGFAFDGQTNGRGGVTIRQMVRRRDEDEWRSLSTSEYGDGALETLGIELPTTVEIGGAAIRILNQDDESVTIEPLTVSSGHTIYTFMVMEPG